MNPPAKRGQPLSIREHQVVGLIARGYVNKEIADELGVSTHAVKYYVERALTKLGAKNRAHAVAITLDPGAFA